MAIILKGKTTCTLCGNRLEEGQELVSFPPFVANEFGSAVDILRWRLSCRMLSQTSSLGTQRLDTRRSQNAAALGIRVCIVCKSEITNPDDYLSLGYLVADKTHPLYRYNCAQIHYSCLHKWPTRRLVSEMIRDLSQSGTWRGKSLDSILSSLADTPTSTPRCLTSKERDIERRQELDYSVNRGEIWRTRRLHTFSVRRIWRKVADSGDNYYRKRLLNGGNHTPHGGNWRNSQLTSVNMPPGKVELLASALRIDFRQKRKLLPFRKLQPPRDLKGFPVLSHSLPLRYVTCWLFWSHIGHMNNTRGYCIP